MDDNESPSDDEPPPDYSWYWKKFYNEKDSSKDLFLGLMFCLADDPPPHELWSKAPNPDNIIVPISRNNKFERIRPISSYNEDKGTLDYFVLAS